MRNTIDKGENYNYNYIARARQEIKTSVDDVNETAKQKVRMKEQLTMSKIAVSLGLSRNAVSAVINNRARKFGVSEATEARIKEYIEQIGYVQSKQALQIKNGTRGNTVAILYCGELPQYSHLLEAISYFGHEIEERYGFVEIIGLSPAKVKDGIREQVAKGVDRLIWILNKSAPQEIQNAKILLPLLERIDHVVLYNFFPGNNDDSIKNWESEFIQRGIHLVGFDRFPAYRQAAEMLWRNGHRKIALNEVLFSDSKRVCASTEPLRKVFADRGFEIYGLHPDDGECIAESQLIPTISGNLRTLHAKHQVSCAFIRNDSQAIETIFQLMKYGIKVPEDIAIIGYGGLPLSRMLPVPLTTFRPPVEKMCSRSMDLVNNPVGISGQQCYYEDELILGGTHGK